VTAEKSMNGGHQQDMTRKPCEQCGMPAKQIIHATEGERQGWYCVPCKHFDKAIGRERKL